MADHKGDHPKPKDLVSFLFAFNRAFNQTANRILNPEHPTPSTAVLRIAALVFGVMLCCPLALRGLPTMPAGLVFIILLVVALRVGIYLYRKYQ